MIERICFETPGSLMSLENRTLYYGKGDPVYSTKRDKDKLHFYRNDFFLEEAKPWVSYPQSEELPLGDVEIGSAHSLEWDFPFKDLFFQEFHRFFHEESLQHLQKIVPYSFAISKQKMTKELFFGMLRHALKNLSHYQGHLYAMWDTSGGILGVSPEIIFSYELGKRVKTCALAGTCHREGNIEEFKKNPKENEEHQIVVKSIVDRLSHLGVIEQHPCQIIHLKTLSHLMTPIEVILDREFDFEQILKALHPTPAIGTFPYESDKKWLRHYNAVLPRGYYGAPFGIYDGKKNIGQSILGIRNLQWNENGLKIGTGCGVVRRSECEKEWNEIELKVQAILSTLGLLG